MKSMINVLRAGFAIPALLLATTCAHAGDDPQAPLATNLVGISDFSDEFPFIDMLKSSRDWIPGRAGCFDCRETPTCGGTCPVTIDRDANGFVSTLQPNQEIRTIIHAGAGLPDSRLSTGTYTIRFDGAGTLVPFGVSNIQTPEAGRITFDVPASNTNIGFNITALTPGNPLRNIRVLPPGGVCSNDVQRFCNGGNPCAGGGSCELFATPGVAEARIFQPRFLRNAAPFRMLRYMDWMGTNSSPIVNFADYPTPTSAFWTRVPPQILAALGNTLGSDIWVTLPHRASNAFIDSFATVLRDQFRSDRHIYLEYGNENWNGVFNQNIEIPRDFCPGFPDLAAGCQNDGVSGNGIACERDPNTFSLGAAQGPCFQALLRAWGDRSLQIFDRFDAVFGASARARLERVIAAQAANADLGRQVMVRNITSGAITVASKTDAYAIAPYFGTEYCTPDNGINPATHPAVYANIDNFMADLQSRALPTAIGFMTSNRSMLDNNFGGTGIRLVSYEGGQHLAGIGGFTFDPACNTMLDAANADTRMGALYTSYLNAWKLNGDEFTHFYNVGRWGPFGRWGLLEFQDQVTSTSPKYSAVTAFSDANACWWPNCTLDGSVVVDPELFDDGFEGVAVPACTPAQLLSDAGLESSNPNTAANAFWASTSTNFGTAICTTTTCPDDAGTALPRAGIAWAWFGGINSAETATLSQSVAIPAGNPRHLNFFLRRGLVTAPLDAVLTVKVDGATVRTFDEPAAAESSYVGRTVDLTSFANGASHSVLFEYVSPSGSGKSNFVVDDISIDCTASGS